MSLTYIRIPSLGTVPSYASFASFPPAIGGGTLAWAADTGTLYFDEPQTQTWTISTSAPPSLDVSYVGFGSAAGVLTGESAFSYNEGTNTLTVDNLVLPSSFKIGSGSTVTEILDEDDMTSDSDTALATQQSIKAYIDIQTHASKFIGDFVMGDWTGPTGGYYYLQYSAVTHLRGISPIVQIEEDTGGGSYEEVFVEVLRLDASGNVEIRVSETPDTRFAGRIVII